jgi:hypothetical protein
MSGRHPRVSIAPQARSLGGVSHRRSHVLVLALPDGVESVRKPPVSRPRAGNCHHEPTLCVTAGPVLSQGRRGKGGHRSASQPWRVERGYERGYKGYIQKRDVISKYSADTPSAPFPGRPPTRQGESSPHFESCATRRMAAHEAGWRNAVHRLQCVTTLVTIYPVIGNLPVDVIDTGVATQILELPRGEKNATARKSSTGQK